MKNFMVDQVKPKDKIYLPKGEGKQLLMSSSMLFTTVIALSVSLFYVR